MAEEVCRLLVTSEAGTYADCTLGCGGHAAAILARASGSSKLLGLEVDESSLRVARERLRVYGDRVLLFHASYVELEEVVKRACVGELDGVLFDLGLSSFQLEDGARGFSFSADGPLDMRFDRSRGESAAELLNRLPRRHLAEIFRRYGEVPRAALLSRAIERARSEAPIETTSDLLRAVEGVIGPGRWRQRRLAQVWMALRIAVNGELENLQRGLEAAEACLRRGGTLAVISYHSLEDRIVKRFMKGRRWRALTRKPVRPTEEEVAGNPRARSAKLRVAVKEAA